MKKQTMKHDRAMERRQFLKGTLGAASLVALAGCDNLTQNSWFPSILNKVEKLTERTQRAITPAHALAKEYEEADISRCSRPTAIPIQAQMSMPNMLRRSLLHGRSWWAAWLRYPPVGRSRHSKSCHRGHKLPGTTVSKAGAQSANGPASRSATSCARFSLCHMPAMRSSIVLMWMRTESPTTRVWP